MELCAFLGDEVHIEQHVEVLMHDFAACVLMELQQGMLEMSLTSMSLSTPIDEPSFSGHLGITDDTSKRLGSEDVCYFVYSIVVLLSICLISKLLIHHHIFNYNGIIHEHITAGSQTAPPPYKA